MILGSYPCCGASLAIKLPEQTPVYFSEPCPACGKIIWHRLSRVDPESWTEEDFLLEHIVDPETKTIQLRNPPPSPPELFTPEQLKEFLRKEEFYFLYGDSRGPAPCSILAQGRDAIARMFQVPKRMLE